MSKRAKFITDEEENFGRASRLWDQRKLKAARRLFLQGAKRGHSGCQLNIGYMYDVGIGGKRDRKKAMEWYRRAYRGGDASAAKNIGTIYRDQTKIAIAEQWFVRALRLGDDSSALELAKLLLQRRPQRAAAFLKRAVKSRQIDESALSEAQELLSKLQGASG